MLIEITRKCQVSTDGIKVIILNVGDQPDFPPNLAKIVVEDMKKGKYIEMSQPMAPLNKVAEVPIMKTEFLPAHKDAFVDEQIRESLTVYQYAKEINVKFRNVIKAAKKLNISATHGNSSLTPEEMDRIKAAL